MIVAAVTGSIGMGKSTVSKRLAECGVSIIDADKIVHQLYAGEAVAPIESAFPGTVVDGIVDRARLGAVLVADPEKFGVLEAIVHPLVRAQEKAFLTTHYRNGADIAMIEIPLLFETGAETLFDAVVVVSAPADTQRARVLERPGMTPEKLDELLARQLPDAEKRKRADFVVETTAPVAETALKVDSVLAELLQIKPRAYQQHWA